MALAENPQRTQETATLESIVDDQGGGMSYCGSCDTQIDLQELFDTPPSEPLRCPNPKCDKILVFTDPWISPGGSDF